MLNFFTFLFRKFDVYGYDLWCQMLCQNEKKNDRNYHESIYHERVLSNLEPSFIDVFDGIVSLLYLWLTKKTPRALHEILSLLIKYLKTPFHKELSLYIQIQNIFLGLGFELGSQRIRVWVQFNVPFSQLLLLLDVILTYCAWCYLDLFVTPGQWIETESILDQDILMDTLTCIMKYARPQSGQVYWTHGHS